MTIINKVRKMSNLLLGLSVKNDKYGGIDNIIQICDDFENNIGNYLENNGVNLFSPEYEKIEGFQNLFANSKSFLEHLKFNGGARNFSELESLFLNVYSHYESEYLDMVDDFDVEERKNYFDTILVPILMVADYMGLLSKKWGEG